MKLNPSFVRVVGYVLMFAPVVIEVLTQLVSPHPDFSGVLKLVVAALGGSQAVSTVTDVSKAKVEAKVEARVQEVVASMPPAAQGVRFEE